MIETSHGLDLNFEETKKSLNIPTTSKKTVKYPYALDGIFEEMVKSLRTIDYQQFITRFKWKNLPEGLDSELIERVIYYYGSGMFFFIEELNKWLFLPFGLANESEGIGIDFYGRFKQIRPYSFNGATQSKDKANGKKIAQDIYLGTQIRDNIIDIPMVSEEKEAEKIYKNGAVILFDHSPELAYQVDSRNRVAQPYIKYLKTLLIQTKSAAINSSGFNMFGTETESAASIMQLQLDQINRDRENGQLAAVVSNLLGEAKNLQSNAPAAIQDFFAAVQSADNLRLKSMGISNDGVQQKSQYMNIQEQSMDINDALQIYLNCFMERIKFAAIVNSIWGLDIYPEPLLMPQANEEAPQEEQEGDEKQAQEGTNEN